MNVVFFVIWLVGTGNRNRVTFCRASLLMSLIGVILFVILSAAGITLFTI